MLRISFLFLLLSAATVYGQITINKNHMPGSGDNIEFSTAVPANINISKTGADVTWDYTKLINLGDGVEAYITSLRTPYLLSFGFTTFGKKLIDTIGFSQFQFKNIYSFYQNSNASYRDVGMGFQFAALPLPQTGKHTDPDEIYVFPLEFGDKDSTTFNIEVPISLVIKIGSFFRVGNRVTTVDGWGKISTPYAKNIDCIRVKSVITELDSIKVSTPALNFGQTVTRIEYKWLSTTEKIPLLTITGNVLLGNFVASSVQYRNEWSNVEPITVDFESDRVSPKQGVVVSLTNKSVGDNLTYNWSLTPTTGFKYVNGTSETAENPTLVFQDTGWYSVSLKAADKNGDNNLTKLNYIHVRDKNSSISNLNAVGLNVYPNPTSDYVTIVNNDPHASMLVELIDLTGKTVLQQTGSNQLTLTLSQQTAGIYMLRVTSEDMTHQIKLQIR
ncbi:MAG: PKD repeat protein [Bacteroidia bacterium]|jgi:PKD repeat protein